MPVEAAVEEEEAEDGGEAPRINTIQEAHRTKTTKGNGGSQERPNSTTARTSQSMTWMDSNQAQWSSMKVISQHKPFRHSHLRNDNRPSTAHIVDGTSTYRSMVK